MIWRCPVCSGDLALSESGAVCAHGHQFDRARQGYINLLPAHQKASRDPGDSSEMISARQRFLSAGHYHPLASAMSSFLDAQTSHLASVRLLDCGCGEGYYTNQFAQALSLNRQSLHPGRVQVAGVDISRMALRLAARQYSELTFIVASNFHVPVQASQVDVMTRIFAPGDSLEVHRVLAPQGKLLVVYPGPRHLFELKANVYVNPREHSSPVVPEGFRCLEERRLQFPLTLSEPDQIKALLDMTPFTWSRRHDTKTPLPLHLATQADFLLRCYQSNH
jgi:23S rRNA (guanine745-N1)-methyltransferase